MRHPQPLYLLRTSEYEEIVKLGSLFIFQHRPLLSLLPFTISLPLPTEITSSSRIASCDILNIHFYPRKLQLYASHNFLLSTSNKSSKSANDMPPELRKRKAPATEPAAAPPAKKKGPVAKAVAKVKEAISSAKPKAAKTNGAASTGAVAVGSTITLEGFGGEIETNDGVKTTLKKLVDESKGGVVLFTYPKASTPGCKHQPLLPIKILDANSLSRN